MSHDDCPLREADQCHRPFKAGYTDGDRRLAAVSQDGVDPPEPLRGRRAGGITARFARRPTADDPERAISPTERRIANLRERRVEV